MWRYKKLINLAKTMPFSARTQTMKAWFLDENEQKSDFQLFQKTLRRIFLLTLLNQWRLRRKIISPHVKRILWIHLANHIGDSLMRLSSASLLNDFDVHLYAVQHVADLFIPGKLFKQVFEIGRDERLILKNEYDLIILDDLKSESIQKKKKLFSTVPFVTIHEFFDYCRDDFNFILFSWYRMAYLLREIRFYHDIELRAKLTINIPNEAYQSIKKLCIKRNSIAVAVGGRDDYRNYQGWPSVIKGLHEHHPNLRIILIGSNNGGTIRDRIFAEMRHCNIVDCIAQYSLLETAAIIEKCCMLICADGGLLHLANAVDTPSIALFASVKPEFRSTPRTKLHALYTQRNVNHIHPDEIVNLAITIIEGVAASG